VKNQKKTFLHVKREKSNENAGGSFSRRLSFDLRKLLVRGRKKVRVGKRDQA